MGQEVENPMINYKENEPKVVAFCAECGWALLSQDNLLALEDNEYVCDEACLIDYYGVVTVRGSDI